MAKPIDVIFRMCVSLGLHVSTAVHRASCGCSAPLDVAAWLLSFPASTTAGTSRHAPATPGSELECTCANAGRPAPIVVAAAAADRNVLHHLDLMNCIQFGCRYLDRRQLVRQF